MNLSSDTRWRLLDLVVAVAIVLFAIGPRLAWIDTYAAQVSDEDPPIFSEEQLYNRYAVAWAQGEGTEPREKAFPWHPLASFTHRPPGYTLFLGAVYRVAGVEDFAAVRQLQAWMDALSMALVYALGVLTFGGLVGRASGLTAALASARYDFVLLFVARILSETLFLWLSLVFLVLALVAIRRGWPLLTLAAAYVLGWANLTRPFLVFVLPGYLLWLAIAPSLERRRAHLALAALGMVLAIAPVTWRNWQFHNELILISTNSGYTLFKSISKVEDLSAPEDLGTEEEVDALGLGEVAEQAEFRQRALSYMRNHPEDWSAIFGRKVKVLLAAKDGHKISHRLMATPDDSWFYPLVLLGAVLAVVVRPTVAWHPRLLIWGVIASQVLVSLLANAEVRYRVPLVPLLALLAAGGLWRLVAWVVERRRAALPAA